MIHIMYVRICISNVHTNCICMYVRMYVYRYVWCVQWEPSIIWIFLIMSKYAPSPPKEASCGDFLFCQNNKVNCKAKCLLTEYTYVHISHKNKSLYRIGTIRTVLLCSSVHPILSAMQHHNAPGTYLQWWRSSLYANIYDASAPQCLQWGGSSLLW